MAFYVTSNPKPPEQNYRVILLNCHKYANA
jgi:hypothetical protein